MFKLAAGESSEEDSESSDEEIAEAAETIPVSDLCQPGPAVSATEDRRD